MSVSLRELKREPVKKCRFTTELGELGQNLEFSLCGLAGLEGSRDVFTRTYGAC
jgi:hypothetical protein